jgi:hypothetical protein
VAVSCQCLAWTKPSPSAREARLGSVTEFSLTDVRKRVRDTLSAPIASALLVAGVGLLFFALLLLPPCLACSMGLWPKPLLFLVGIALVAMGVVVWGGKRPRVILGLL